ncbi:MAG TPA: hypothetical protein VKI44_38415 [Acetobacteraceae bacterium]|nr:hypothetical protein [Acetobacteraceae bacterium]
MPWSRTHWIEIGSPRTGMTHRSSSFSHLRLSWDQQREATVPPVSTRWAVERFLFWTGYDQPLAQSFKARSNHPLRKREPAGYMGDIDCRSSTLGTKLPATIRETVA